MISLKRKKGATLAEIMIYIVVLGLVLSGIYGILISTLKYYRTAQTQTDLQRNLVECLSSFTNDIAISRISSVTASTTGNIGVMFPSPKDINEQYSLTSSGNLKWQKWVCYYLQSVNVPSENRNMMCLLRREQPIAPVDDNPGSPPSDISSIYNFINKSTLNNQYNQKIIARGVTGFNISTDLPTKMVNLTITVDWTTDATKPNSITLQNVKILVRN
jgi:hypothetical protein